MAQPSRLGQNAGATLTYVPQLRPYLLPLVVVVCAVAVRIGSRRVEVTTLMTCEAVLFDRQLFGMRCKAAPGTRTCEEERTRAIAILDSTGGASSIRINGREATADEARAAVAACVGQYPPAPSSVTIPINGVAPSTTYTRLSIRGEQGAVPWLSLFASLLALVLTLPTRIVRARVDREGGTLRVKEWRLLRRPREVGCMLHEITDVVVRPDDIALLRGGAEPLPLTARDGRPEALRERTASWLRSFLATAG